MQSWRATRMRDVCFQCLRRYRVCRCIYLRTEVPRCSASASAARRLSAWIKGKSAGRISHPAASAVAATPQAILSPMPGSCRCAVCAASTTCQGRPLSCAACVTQSRTRLPSNSSCSLSVPAAARKSVLRPAARIKTVGSCAGMVGIMGTLVGQYFQCPVFKKFTLRKGLLRRATRTIRAWIRLTPLTR